jgi:hypothetical protein
MDNKEIYPKDFQEFLVQFPNEEACWKYINRDRWSEGYRCSKCESTKHWLTAKHKLHCSVCGKEVSITGGTIFQETKKPLLLWFYIMWWVCSTENRYQCVQFEGFHGTWLL